eukprot:2195383-Pyramimonas_sp.AAC.1
MLAPPIRQPRRVGGLQGRLEADRSRPSSRPGHLVLAVGYQVRRLHAAHGAGAAELAQAPAGAH